VYRRTRPICSSTQDAAYGTLLREPRRALHARIAETVESQFADIAESQPELVARHCTEAGLIEKAAGLWGKAAQRSLERSALAEAVAQLTRALDQIATLSSTPALRREEIELQVALITPLQHVKGYAAPETRAAAERASVLIRQAETLGEPPDDPLLLFRSLYGGGIANFVAFNGDLAGEFAARFLSLAEQQKTTAPLMIGHRLMGMALVFKGEFARARIHFDRAITLYDPAAHRPLAALFGQDNNVAALTLRSWSLWLLGYPDTALADVEYALKHAREIDPRMRGFGTLMYALTLASWIPILCGKYAAANAHSDEAVALAEEKGTLMWKAFGTVPRGHVLALTGKASDAVHVINAGITACQSTGSTFWMPWYLSNLAEAHAQLNEVNEAGRYIGEAMTTLKTAKENWCEAEVCRVAGEIALVGPKPDAAKAEAYFERALSVAHHQQAKSWELRASMSLARLWRSQGKVQQARELLDPVYGWFTEGFETRDLKEAKTLLEQLAT
jgi:predicted ATPase